MKMNINERYTWRSCIDGYTDTGLYDGITKGDVVCQLADYEDIGLSPSEINEITKGIHILKKEIRAKIIREFAKKHKRIMLKFLDDDNEFAMKWCEYEVNTDNLVKEMTEEFE